MITKNKRYSLAFDKEIDTLIRLLVKQTDWKICVVFQKAIELLNKELNNKDEG